MNILKNCGSISKLASFTGTIDYPLVNDYMFRSVMQSNENVLKSFLCSLLHLNPDDVWSVQILNPIELGKKISDKDFILDIKILMNNNTSINLEMQVNNQYNWPERSLVYLSRLFDGLNAGDTYRTVKPAFQIGILDFTLFPQRPEFFGTYKMMNVKNYHKYSDKFTIHVLDLTQIHLAAKEDKEYGLDKWARLFKALTWEDFKMISAGNKSMQEAGETLFALNGDDRIRDRCEAREDYRRTWDGVKQEIEELKSSNRKKDAEITELKSSNKNKDSLICSLEEQVATLRQQLQSDIN
ncbi:MAG: Rpn family recombination-promoting nuclease/putative transposase [Lachnospiraceae bacterium]|nr:Rpn family recombination-promoting nuclease/putative transposase [Lachnospiraceae bacterium]